VLELLIIFSDQYFINLKNSTFIFWFGEEKMVGLWNSFKVTILLSVLTGLFLGAGYLMGGQSGLIFAFAFALIMNFVSYWFSDKIVLSMYRAKEASKKSYPKIYSMTLELCKNASLPMPKLYVINSDNPNAFATGRSPKHSAVALTTGIMSLLTDKELKGVIAHELAHIKNRDTLISTMAATIAGAIGMIANMVQWAAIFGGFSRDNDNGGNIVGALALAILTPFIAIIIQLAISRSREYYADKTGAEFSSDPNALASALLKLEKGSKQKPLRSDNKTAASLFIVNPFSRKGFINLFSTHPPIEERVKRLRK
jgi:heat shock protein HtpX